MKRMAAIALLLAIVGCAGSESPLDPQSGTSISIDIVAGQAQVDTVGQVLPTPLTVLATDGKGSPIEGLTVNFVVMAGGGSVFAGAVSTDADGFASDIWTLGTTANTEQRVEVRAMVGTTPKVFGSFTATALPGAPVRLTAVPTDFDLFLRDTVALDTLIQSVTAWDQYYNALGPVTDWTATAVPLSDGTERLGQDGMLVWGLALGTVAIRIEAQGSQGSLTARVWRDLRDFGQNWREFSRVLYEPPDTIRPDKIADSTHVAIVIDSLWFDHWVSGEAGFMARNIERQFTMFYHDPVGDSAYTVGEITPINPDNPDLATSEIWQAMYDLRVRLNGLLSNGYLDRVSDVPRIYDAEPEVYWNGNIKRTSFRRLEQIVE